ncbi:hypothetical protein NS220_17700 [Microbacterium testaceum]|uniref:Uncharacterized protein n=1 Tax=Microbacterium testaceum TaxID=2033 RepID=A0A147ESB4_MICTE|nr:hypothetical protein [Microbacterium testaceum]KTR87524.1 hypothetical protein NS220_17700 [Microbacterium testaceum]
MDYATYCAELSAEADRITQASLAAARACASQGDAGGAKRELRAGTQELRLLKQQANAAAADVRLQIQEQRVAVDKKGRTIANIVGRGTFGTALRGGMARSRTTQNAQLSRMKNDLALEKARLDAVVDRATLTLAQEGNRLG